MSVSSDITIVILTYNEENNLPYALENVKEFAKEIVVVDSNSIDSTVEIAQSYGARIYKRAFDDFSRQRKYALEKISYNTEWLFVLDADEYLTESLKAEIHKTLNFTKMDGFFVKRRFYWKGKWIKRGYYPIWLLRLGRVGFITCDERPINEHLICKSNKVGYLKYDFIDENRKSLFEWIEKHNIYSDREADELLKESDNQKYSPWKSQYEMKRWIRVYVWKHIPVIIRPFSYFIYRYFIRLGFLDGKEALMYHFLHAFIYRMLIDLKFLEKKWLIRSKKDLGA